MRGKITIRSVAALTPEGGKEATLRDTVLAGFEVRARRGGAKVYSARYRVGGGRNAPMRRETIGPHGAWTPETARAKAREILGRVARGEDPAADKMARRQAPTVADLAQRFLTEHVEPKRKASTAAEYKRLLDNIILPALGKRKVADVTRADITKLHHANRAAPFQANRCLAVSSAMFNMAERWVLRPDGSNPCRHVERFAERKRERFLSPAELARLGDALAAYDGSSYAVAAVKLLIFSGARLGEVLTLKWEWIDFERGVARLPDSKEGGAKDLHLPPPALALLAKLPRVEGNRYVIVGRVAGASLVNLQNSWQAIRKAAGLDHLRLHDLRHSFASVGAASGLSLLVIGRLLGHSQPGTTARYAHFADDPLKSAADSIAAKIATAMTGGSGKGVEADAAVVPLRSGA
jgi:integrase